MPYFVSRQQYWPEGTPVVEVACGGCDFANADMLVPHYPGEGREYEDPRGAVEVACEILRAWRKAGKRKAKIAYGSTGGFTLPFEPRTIREAQKWAEETYEKLEKCECCGKILPGKRERFGHDFTDGHPFCSERCAEKDYCAQAAALDESEES